MPLHVTIADYHGAIRIGMKYMISNWMPGTRISFAENMAELAALLALNTVDLVVLDLDLPGGNTFQMVRDIKAKQRQVRVLVFSAYDEELYALRYLDVGADGYLQKDRGEEDIKEALNTVLHGKKYLSNRVKDSVLQYRLRSGKFQENPLAGLSNRELEVCQLLVKGKGVGEIANELDLHTSTIGTYKNHIFQKLEVRNMVELTDTFRLHSERKI